MNKEQDWKQCPYPEKIFSPLTEIEQEQISDFLNEYDIALDRLSAHYGRILWKAFVSVADRTIQDLQKENASLKKEVTELKELKEILMETDLIKTRIIENQKIENESLIKEFVDNQQPSIYYGGVLGKQDS